ASATTDNRAPGSTVDRARSVPLRRDQPPRTGAGTAVLHNARLSPRSAVTDTAVPGGIRCGSKINETPRCSPGWSRIGDCLNRIGALWTVGSDSGARADRALLPPIDSRSTRGAFPPLPFRVNPTDPGASK